MGTITRQELNDWKKQFQVGDKVKITTEGTYFGMTGVVSSKTSYVYVDLENGQQLGVRRGLEVIEKFVKPKKEKVKSYNLSRSSKLYKELVDDGYNRYNFASWLKGKDYVVSGIKFDEHSNRDTEKAEYKNGEGELKKVLDYFFYNWELTKENYGSKRDDGTFYYSTSWSYDGFSHRSVIITNQPLDEIYKKYLVVVKKIEKALAVS
jgi:hypothetical protein